MDEVMKLKKIADFGIPINVLARECHCSSTSIRNYLTGASLPNGSKVMAIKDGLNHLLNTIEAIVRE